MESIQQVIDRFDFQGKTADCRAFGNGHINTTYIITTDLPELLTRKFFFSSSLPKSSIEKCSPIE